MAYRRHEKVQLWEIAVETVPEAEDALTELLATIFSHPCSSYTDFETGITRISLFTVRPKALDHVTRVRIRTGLETAKSCGLKIGRGTITCKKVRRQDWSESWKRHFKPIEIGRALLIKPSWNKRTPRHGQSVVVLDPGLSFGTGQHPTTAFCLEQLVKVRDRAGRSSILDIGTGSGILAIAAAKLGFRPVEAFDFDTEAVRIARANARRNGVAGRIRFSLRDVTKLGRKPAKQYGLICANLTGNLLEESAERIVARLNDVGVLVLAGILEVEFSGVKKVYERAGLRLLTSREKGEWKSGAFSRTQTLR